MGRADLPTSLPLLGPELDRLLTGDHLAAPEQRRLAGDQLAGVELQGLGIPPVADGADVQHPPAFEEPAALWRYRWAYADLVGIVRRSPRPPSQILRLRFANILTLPAASG